MSMSKEQGWEDYFCGVTRVYNREKGVLEHVQCGRLAGHFYVGFGWKRFYRMVLMKIFTFINRCPEHDSEPWTIEDFTTYTEMKFSTPAPVEDDFIHRLGRREKMIAGKITRWLYPNIEWKLLDLPNREDFDSEEDYDHRFRMIMILNDATMAMWPPKWRFELDFAWKIAFPILVVASFVIPFVVVFLFGGG